MKVVRSAKTKDIITNKERFLHRWLLVRNQLQHIFGNVAFVFPERFRALFET
jgi:hypothetical protein